MEAISQDFLIQVIGNSPFLAFLIWQFLQQRKDYKEQSEDLRKLRIEAQERGDKLRAEAEEKEEKLRERFDGVITGLNQDRDQLVSIMEKRLTTVENQIKKLFVLIHNLRDQLKEIEKNRV